MIEIKDTYVDNLICHKISADSSNDVIASSTSNIHKQDFDANVLRDILLKPFLNESKVYEFSHEFDITLNPLRKLALSIYDNEDFVLKSKEIYKHLNSVSRHPNIKEGDLNIVKFKDILLKYKFY